MSDPVNVRLPPDLRAFAEEQVRSGKAPSVEAVLREALAQRRLEALRAELHVGIRELDDGLGVESSVEELMADASREAGIGE